MQVQRYRIINLGHCKISRQREGRVAPARPAGTIRPPATAQSNSPSLGDYQVHSGRASGKTLRAGGSRLIPAGAGAHASDPRLRRCAIAAPSDPRHRRSFYTANLFK